MLLRFIVLTGVILLLSGALTGVRAQGVEVVSLDEKLIRISYWKASNGLPTWHIYDMIQDDRKLVWMGTEQGLVSLDGQHFKIHPLKGEPALVQNIRRIILDAQQNLWLFCASGSNDITILIYDPYLEKTITFEDYTSDSVKFSNSAIETAHKADSLIWVLDTRRGIGGYFSPDNLWHEVLHTTPIEDHGHYYFPAPNRHFWHLNRSKNSVDFIQSTGDILAHHTLPPTFVILDYRMGKDGFPYLLGLEKGQKEHPLRLLRCDASQGLVPVSDREMFTLSWCPLSNYVYKLTPVRANHPKGYNLILVKNEQLSVFDGDRPLYPHLESHLHKNGIQKLESRIFFLTDGSFWMIGTGALVRIEVAANPFTTYFNDLPTFPSTRGIGSYGNSLFVNSYSGLFEINKQTRKSKVLHKHKGKGLSLAYPTIWSNLNTRSIASLDLDGNSCQSHPLDPEGRLGELMSVYVSPSGAVYTGYSTAVFYKAPAEKEFHRLPDVSGGTFLAGRAGLWIGGTDGLWLLNQTNQPIKHFTKEIAFNGQMPSNIYHIHEDASGMFWMATNEGLWRWNPENNEVQTYTMESHDLPTNIIHAVYEDRYERLWIPSQNGLLCFDKKKFALRTFTATDGLSGNEFNQLSHYQDHSGRLYLGGISGLTSFQPGSLAELPDQGLNIQLSGLYLKNNASSDPPINLTSAFLFGNKTLLIPYSTAEFEINYCVPAFTGEKIEYRWRIPEIDSSWHHLTEPKFSIFNLPFGAYTLELGAYIPGNSFSQIASLNLPIQVDKPYYLKAWFLALATVYLLVLMLLIFRWRQRQLRRHNHQLAAEMAQKTVQLKQERDVIAQQKETLQKLYEEKNYFFQELSHEFRNPLSLIIGPTNDLLKQEAMPARFLPRLEQVRRNAQKILKLINELLELSKLEAGVVPINQTQLPLAVLIERICQDFESSAVQKQIALQLTQSFPDDLVVITDGRKLEKILINLIQNALKYTPSGGSVHVKAQWISQGILDVWISDTGIGITPEHLDRVFERYYQVPIGRTQISKGGFGIGLSLCRHYATLLGGNISVYSQPGLGTDMHVTIPCKEGADHTLPEKKQLFATAQTPAQHPQKRLLLVDDQAEMLEYIADLLSPTYQIIKASSGEQAMDILERQSIDLIISDFMMQGMSGLELLTHVRQKTPLQHTPFVLLTGLEASHFEEEARRQQVTSIFNKPIDASRFLADIQQLLQPHR
jgi:signal transduction histidine kinase/CheY-like chemotaxis protein